MDLNIKNLDDDVGDRLKAQATAEGLSVQEYLRRILTRVARRPSPAEFARREPVMTRAEFEAIRKRLRGVDGA